MFNDGKVEYSSDGGQTWEVIRLPWNCTPFHQVQLLGHYEQGDNMYRSASAHRALAS
jgi:hypothetical protein